MFARRKCASWLAQATRRHLSSSPVPQRSEERAALRDVLRAWTKENVEPQALEFNREEKFNKALLVQLARDLDVLGPTVATEDGGAGLDAAGACVVCEELSRSDPAFALSYLAHAILFVNNLYDNGSAAQKQKYLGRCLRGDLVGGMAMTEPGAGTDVLGMQTTALKREDGCWVLNGRKLWITNGAHDDNTLGDVFLVYAKTDERKLSLFVAENGTAGFSLGQRIKDKCGMRASPTAELVFEDCVLTQSSLVGEEHKGVAPMMRNLELERLCLAAMSCGIAGRCLDAMRHYAADRVAFGKPIRDFGQIQRHLAESYAHFRAAKTFLYAVAAKGHHTRNRLDSDAAKLVASEMASAVANRAVQVLGANGYVADFVVERLWRDAKLLEIGGGTSEAHHKNIAADLHAFYNGQDLPEDDD
mmetsp:Transcript_12851/g.38768  ORF Transcript_12851/g.38768 Transcript_12851/m.38768 type:complete len:417 (+) Transcript_12851:67-1317(+)